jgi:hypothetical protein
MSITIRATGAYAIGTANLNPVIPIGAVAGDMMLCFYGVKPFSDVPAMDNGWTDLGFATDGVVPPGSNVGSMQVRAWYKIHTGTEFNPNIITASNDISGAVIIVFQKAPGMNWGVPVGVGGGDATAGTGFSVTAGSNPGILAGDMLAGYAAIRANAGLQSAITITATGITVGAFTESPGADMTSNSGGSMAMSGGYAPVSSGTAVAAPVYAATLSNSHTGSAFMVRLREVDPPDIIVPVLGGPAILSSITQSSMLLSWPAATDNVGVTGYAVNWRPVGGITWSSRLVATLFSMFDALAAGTAYEFTYQARDAAGNWSAISATVVGVTLPLAPPLSGGSMWVLLTISPAFFTFQVKSPTGVDIGAPYVFDRLIHRIMHPQRNDLYITIYPMAAEDGSFPFLAQFPRSRIIVILVP